MPEERMSQPRGPLIRRIANQLCDADQILREINSQKQERPEWERDAGEVGNQAVPPRTVTERRIVEIWAEVLGLEHVGIHEDFFALGGHSLLATQVISRLRDAFQVELPIAVIFNGALTVADLAREIEHYQITQAETEEVAQMLDDVADLSEDEVNKLLLSLTDDKKEHLNS